MFDFSFIIKVIAIDWAIWEARQEGGPKPFLVIWYEYYRFLNHLWAQLEGIATGGREPEVGGMEAKVGGMEPEVGGMEAETCGLEPQQVSTWAQQFTVLSEN